MLGFPASIPPSPAVCNIKSELQMKYVGVFLLSLQREIKMTKPLHKIYQLSKKKKKGTTKNSN